jgi:hypothetical protein
MTLRRASFLLAAMLALGLAPACSVDGKNHAPLPDASPATQDAGPGSLPYLAECVDDAQCMSGICFPFNAKGPHCTHACETNADCEAPSPGCSNNKVCKVP